MEKQTEEYHDEINLYDIWMVLVRRKRLIICLFLVAVISVAIISSLMPKIYRGQAVISIWQNDVASMPMTEKEVISPKEIISASEIVDIIGNVDAEKRMEILPNTHASVTNIKINLMRASNDKFMVIIDAKNVDDIPKALSELLNYLNNFEIVKLAVKKEREKLLSRLDELSGIIQSSSDLLITYQKLLKAGKLVAIDFNPVDLYTKIAYIKLEKLAVEQSLQRMKDGSIGVSSQLYVSKRPVNQRKTVNVVLAGIAALFLGILLSLIMEYVKKK